MSNCQWGKNLVCVNCGYRARVAGSRRACDRSNGKGPGIFANVSSYARALAAWYAAGRPTRTPEQIQGILDEHCNPPSGPCIWFTGKACRKCGCAVNSSSRGWMNKLAMGTESCPIGLWGAESAGAPAPSKIPRVGFILPVLLWGGVERWHIDLIRELMKAVAVEVAGVAFVGEPNRINPDIVSQLAAMCPVIGAVQMPGVEIVARPEEAIYALAAGSDALVCWSISGPIIEAVKATGKPIVGVSHGCEDWWMSEAKAVVNHWVAVSKSARAPVPSPHVTVLENGVDLDRLATTLSRDDVRRAAGIPLDARVIVSIGRLSREKRLEIQASALDRLPPDCWLWLVGDGSDAERIRTAAGPSAGRLVISPSRADIGNVLAAADVFAFTSRAEGYGLAPVEALAAGVPLVATPVGILPFLGDCAEWLPLDPTAGQVADAVLSAIRPNRCRVEASQAIVLANHTSVAMARRWAEFLRSIHVGGKCESK